MMMQWLKLAAIGGVAAWAWKHGRDSGLQSHASVSRSDAPNPVRDAGPDEQEGISAQDWDLIDQQADESFPASDPPANYRGVH
ncbi:hypothetical protein GGR44_000435 [Sphingobium fontiphilum]|uniref:Uncharacterized protein n=1 Tax=Sphingobium fontiphilum TaxID=944425 RepID=A0A7W6DKN3_9SPHN|nr:hypothetical protein [Sphingobium fontiphilum]MBB3980804.1 hypothetical protein [Sphingobium fontiphilum]